MATQQELLAKLEERFILGEISKEQYAELRASVMARGGPTPQPAQAPPAHASATVAGPQLDNTVIKGDISSTTGAASVGNVIVNVPADGRGNSEVEYEGVVLAILRSGGQLDGARGELDGRRQRLGLTLRLSRDIEQACYQVVSQERRGFGPQATGPTPHGPPNLPPAGPRFFQTDAPINQDPAGPQGFLGGQIPGQGSPPMSNQPSAMVQWLMKWGIQPAEPGAPRNPMAIVTLVLGILSLMTHAAFVLFAMGACVTGTIAHQQIKKSAGKQDGYMMALWGVALALFSFLVWGSYFANEGL